MNKVALNRLANGLIKKAAYPQFPESGYFSEEQFPDLMENMAKKLPKGSDERILGNNIAKAEWSALRPSMKQYTDAKRRRIYNQYNELMSRPSAAPAQAVPANIPPAPRNIGEPNMYRNAVTAAKYPAIYAYQGTPNNAVSAAPEELVTSKFVTKPVSAISSDRGNVETMYNTQPMQSADSSKWVINESPAISAYQGTPNNTEITQKAQPVLSKRPAEPVMYLSSKW